MDAIIKLMNLVERKRQIDLDNEWYEGACTYLSEMRKELVEVENELNSNLLSRLEDELGDVLWDYLNLLRCLADEKEISADAVFARAVRKYDERISGIEKGMSWSEIKAEQKQREAHAGPISDKGDSA